MIMDYMTDNKISEEELPPEQDIVDIITEKVEEEINEEEIEEEIEKVKEINDDGGISREYWNSRF